VMGWDQYVRSTLGFDFPPLLSSIMPKDPTEKKKRRRKKREKREKEEKRGRRRGSCRSSYHGRSRGCRNGRQRRGYQGIFFLVPADRAHAHQQQVTKKSKKEKKERQDEVVVPVDELSPIAHPLAQRKLLKKLNKTVKKGMGSFDFSLAADRCGHSSFESPPGETRCEGGGERYQEGRERVSTKSIQSSPRPLTARISAS
jgi:hypothetical protein